MPAASIYSGVLQLDGPACCPACVLEFSHRCGSWRDVVKKARHIRASGGVTVHSADKMYMEASVTGDHDTYDVKIYRQNTDSVRITHWSCRCEWGQWAFKRQHTFVGRTCSHALACYWEMRAQDLKRVPKDYSYPEMVQFPLPGMSPGRVDWKPAMRSSSFAPISIGPLYHGTTVEDADRILAGGFQANTETRKGTIYLTRDRSLSDRYAQGAVVRAQRAGRADAQPAVIEVHHIQGVPSSAYGYMDDDLAREAGADFHDKHDEIVVLNPEAIKGPIRRIASRVALGRQSSAPGLEVRVREFSDPFIPGSGPIVYSDSGLAYDAYIDNGYVGGMMLRKRLSNDVWTVYRIQVYDEYQRRGIATALLAKARADLGQVVHAPMNERSDEGKAWSAVVGARPKVTCSRCGRELFGGGRDWRDEKDSPFCWMNAPDTPVHQPVVGRPAGRLVADWNEEQHPRGQPENGGEFAPRGEGQSGPDKAPKGTAEVVRQELDDWRKQPTRERNKRQQAALRSVAANVDASADELVRALGAADPWMWENVVNVLDGKPDSAFSVRGWGLAKPPRYPGYKQITPDTLTDDVKQRLKEIAVSQLLADWQNNANGTIRADTAQEVAKKAFGLANKSQVRKNSPGAYSEYGRDQRIPERIDKIGDTLAKVQRGQYKSTQRYLQERGIRSLRLYRGVEGEYDETRERPLASWALSADMAQQFTGRSGHVVDQEIPAERIFALPMTGTGSLDEGEVVVLSDKPTKTARVRNLV